MKTYDEAVEECLIQMFTRVGEYYPNKKLTNQKDWYTKRSWTEEEQEDFSKWMEKYLKKHFKWNKRMIGNEVGMFLLNWGWTTK
jgi:type IV secretory pathway component VirB8